ncbi:uncharacterized protein V6R79_003001 [Siganus canaliculatus]
MRQAQTSVTQKKNVTQGTIRCDETDVRTLLQSRRNIYSETLAQNVQNVQRLRVTSLFVPVLLFIFHTPPAPVTHESTSLCGTPEIKKRAEDLDQLLQVVVSGVICTWFVAVEQKPSRSARQLVIVTKKTTNGCKDAKQQLQ